MPKVTIITNNDFSGILFLNYLLRKGVEIEKMYLVASIRGGFFEKLQKGLSLLSKKSVKFLLYRSFVEKTFFKKLVLDGVHLLTMDQVSKKYNISMETVKDVDHPKFVSQFSKFKSSNDLVLSAYGSQIFSAALIDQVKNFWNIHGSYLPYFRGAAPYFWMLFKEDYPRGVTIHQVTKKLDAGQIIRQIEVVPESKDSLLLYHARCVLAAGRLFVSVFLNDYQQIIEDLSAQRHAGKAISRFASPSDRPVRQHGLPLSCDIENFRKAGKVFFHWEDFEKIKELVAKDTETKKQVTNQ